MHLPYHRCLVGPMQWLNNNCGHKPIAKCLLTQTAQVAVWQYKRDADSIPACKNAMKFELWTRWYLDTYLWRIYYHTTYITIQTKVYTLDIKRVYILCKLVTIIMYFIYENGALDEDISQGQTSYNTNDLVLIILIFTAFRIYVSLVRYNTLTSINTALM